MKTPKGILAATRVLELLPEVSGLAPGSLLMRPGGAASSRPRPSARAGRQWRSCCARSFKMRMTASFAVSMCGREYGPAGVRRRGLGVRGGVVVVSLT
jgi:hypothetical protein